MKKTWAIRRAVASDAAALALLGNALSLNEGEPTGNFTEEAIRRDCFGDAPELMIWVADSGDALVGYASVHLAYVSAMAQRGYYMEDLYVDSQWRHHGIARALIGAVVATAQSDGRAIVSWTSHLANEEAHHFYRSIGAREERLVNHSLTPEDFAAATAHPSSVK